jgi:hypothetical protein
MCELVVVSASVIGCFMCELVVVSASVIDCFMCELVVVSTYVIGSLRLNIRFTTCLLIILIVGSLLSSELFGIRRNFQQALVALFV